MKRLTITAMVLFLAAGSAWADISSVAGDLVYFPAIPSNLGLHAYESSTNFYVFNEQQDLTLADSVFADILLPGTYNQASDLTGAGGTIAAGTRVNSYLLHVDPVGIPNGLIPYSGSITFSNQVLGVIVTTANLNATDSILGVGTTTYYTGANRGLEWTNQDDIQLSISLDGMTMYLQALEIIDNVRVVEASPVPVPGAVLLGLLGLGAAGVKLRKRG